MQQDEHGENFIGPNGFLPNDESRKFQDLANNLKLREHNMSEMIAHFEGNKEKLHDMLDGMWYCYIVNYASGFPDDEGKTLDEFMRFYIYLNRYLRASQMTVEEKDINYRP